MGFFLLAATPIVTGASPPYVIFLAAFAGALAAMALVLAVSSRVQNLAMLLVIGMMIGYICDAGTDFMITFAESSQLQNFTIWTMGSFSGMTWATLGGLRPDHHPHGGAGVSPVQAPGGLSAG